MTLKDWKRRFVPFTVAEFFARYNVYNSTPVQIRVVEAISCTHSLLTRNLFAQKMKDIYDKQKWKQMFAEIIRFKKIGQRMLQENDFSSRAIVPPCQHFIGSYKNDTTKLFGYKLGELTGNNKSLPFSSGKKTIQTFNGSMHLSHYAVVCEIINL